MYICSCRSRWGGQSRCTSLRCMRAPGITSLAPQLSRLISSLPLTDACRRASLGCSQGMTLDRVEMSLRNVFECGQMYVALSRVKSLEGLSLQVSSATSPQALRPLQLCCFLTSAHSLLTSHISHLNTSPRAVGPRLEQAQGASKGARVAPGRAWRSRAGGGDGGGAVELAAVGIGGRRVDPSQ